MAKNKTAKKDALSSSEPKVMGLTGWTGINIKDNSPAWDATLSDQYNNANLKNKLLLVQNNLDTTSSGDLECRADTQHIAIAPDGVEFTGVACLHESMLYCAFSDESIRVHDIMDEDLSSWEMLEITDADVEDTDDSDEENPWTCLGFYEQVFIALRQNPEIYTGSFSEENELGHIWCPSISSAKLVPNPHTAPALEVKGTLQEVDVEEYVTRVSVTYAYANRFGSTLDFGSDPLADWPTMYLDSSPAEWSAAKYLKISGNIADDLGENWQDYAVTGIDLYERQDENSDAIFIGHVEPAEDGSWYYNWLGAMSDTSVWTDVPLTIPSENSTKGVNACYFNVHDGRLYFWGGEEKYRLWIGGNPGNELSVAIGTGGAYVDIEPGSGIEVKGTAKFKTYNGASIVTIMCGNPNSGKVKRYNLLETNLTVTSEISTKSYSTEEVANVVGCNSVYGFGSFYDGLYAVNRYGLLVTTAVMESNNQLRVNTVSDYVAPLFTESVAARLEQARLLYINEIIYICLGDENNGQLDNMILCYDLSAKAWYTYTYDEDVAIRHIMNIDYLGHDEGIGIITADKVDLIPTTGSQEPTAPAFETFFETGELAAKLPIQGMSYLDQVEFRFDYIIGQADITIEGTDYYGRHQTIVKHIEEPEARYRWPIYVKVGLIMESWHIKIRGCARYRMTHILFKLYSQSSLIGIPYGFDTSSSYHTRHGADAYVHHEIKNYNNLKEAIVS